MDASYAVGLDTKEGLHKCLIKEGLKMRQGLIARFS